MKKNYFEKNLMSLYFIFIIKVFIIWIWVLHFTSYTFQSEFCYSFPSFYALIFTFKGLFLSFKSLIYLFVDFVTVKAYWISPVFPLLFFRSLSFAFIVVYKLKIITFTFTFVTHVLFSVFTPNYTNQCIFFSINWIFLNLSLNF